MGQRDTQTVVEPLIGGSTSARDRQTQLVAEAAMFATSGLPRGTQLVAEAAMFATSELPRGTQLVVEVVVALAGASFVGEPGGGVW